MVARYEPFSRADIERIDSATVRVFENTGIRVLEDEAAGLLVSAGASYDKKTRIVKVPEHVLRDSISSAPSKFKMHGRDGKHTIAFGEGKVHLSSAGTSVQVEGLDGIVRPSTSKDAENFFKLTDALPNIDHSSWVCWPRDMPDAVAPLQEIYLAFKHSMKTTDGWNLGKVGSEQSIDLAAIVAGGREELAARPMLLGFANPVSPLTLSRDATEGLIVYARAGQPTCYPPECMAGGTSPATIAGLLVQQNVEVLASVAVAQLAKRGAPSLYSTVSGMMDMRTGLIVLGASEVGLIMAGAAQLARHYRMPIRGTGGNTDAMSTDYQSGVETATTMLLAAMAGIDFVYDAAGSLESSLTAGYAKLLLDNDVCGEVRRVLAGVEVSEETLAVEAIASSAMSGGFLSNPHTLRHFRKENYIPGSFWRGSRSVWDSQGDRKDIVANARKRVAQILKDHRVEVPLDPEADRKMVELIKSVAKRS